MSRSIAEWVARHRGQAVPPFCVFLPVLNDEGAQAVSIGQAEGIEDDVEQGNTGEEFEARIVAAMDAGVQ